MSQTMRAKFVVTSVTKPCEGSEELTFRAVSDTPFDAEGASEDNSFARYTPSGTLSMTVQNPALLGKFIPGDKFYLDFTPADSIT